MENPAKHSLRQSDTAIAVENAADNDKHLGGVEWVSPTLTCFAVPEAV